MVPGAEHEGARRGVSAGGLVSCFRTYFAWVVIEAVLLARLGSAVAAETVTVFVIDDLLAITVTTI